ncbi:hypothetical protein EBZ39_19340 [bacterium]|nr:hypothetical protein [bacterium]
MDIEQFKLLLEAINSAGEGAKEFGLWWLACRTIPAVLWFVFGISLLFVISRRIHEAVVTWSAAYAIGREFGHAPFAWDEFDTNAVVTKIRNLKSCVKNS